MLDKDFFSRYNGVYGKDKGPEGIPGFQMNKPAASSRYKGRIGLELEIEARSPTPNEGHLDALVSDDTKAKWMAIRDGSLRGDYAREYIVNKPINREELRPMLEGLFAMFKTMKSKIDNSNRCSTHVHLNMGSKKINEITAVMCLWTIFEQSLINFCGEERQTNHFALSSSESNATLTAWEQYLRYGHAHWDRNLKYQAMNVLPLFEKGSLEIRCGAAANDAEGPIVWATLLDHLVDFAIERYSKGIPLIGSDLSERGGSSLFEELCSRDSILLPVYGNVIAGSGGNELFNDACLRGFRNCQPLVYGFPWEAWHKMIEKEYVPDPFAREAPKVKISRAGAARPGRLFGEAVPAPPRDREWEAQVQDQINRHRQEALAAMRIDPVPIDAPVPRGRPRARNAHAEFRMNENGVVERVELNEPMPLQAGDRVSYVRGNMRRRGARGTIERIEGVEFFRYFVRWDDEPGQEIRWCNRNQLELIGIEGDPEPAPEVEEEEEEDVWGFDIEEPEEDIGDDF